MSTKLEQIGIIKRNEAIIRNDFNNTDASKMYSATHTKALSDELTPIQGKGTGGEMDSSNGGSMVDIYGNPNIPHSGRVGNISYNSYKEGNEYGISNSSNDTGEVNI